MIKTFPLLFSPLQFFVFRFAKCAAKECCPCPARPYAGNDKERAKLGLSQEGLAAKTGVHRTYIGMIERAEKNITLENIEKVAKVLGLKLSDFFSGF